MRGHGEPCEYCKREMRGDVAPDHPLRATKDHYMPKSKRKGDDATIIVMACWTCNQAKADRFPEQWDRYMLRNPRWWEPFEKVKRQPVQRIAKAPPWQETRQYLQEANFRALKKNEPIPIAYDDPLAQAAYEGAYKDRKWLLRVPCA